MGVHKGITGLDSEWVELMKMARDKGITKEEIQQFILQQSAQNHASMEEKASI